MGSDYAELGSLAREEGESPGMDYGSEVGVTLY